MSPEEKKLFEEFKIVVESVEANTYDKYIKPHLEESRKENKLFLIITTLEFFIILILLIYKDVLNFFNIQI